jgi:hypothetical protein
MDVPIRAVVLTVEVQKISHLTQTFPARRPLELRCAGGILRKTIQRQSYFSTCLTPVAFG